MTTPAVFNFKSEAVRIFADDPENPLFVATDVAKTLGYKHAASAIKTHCNGVVKHHPLQTSGGLQQVRVIKEPDVYRLIFGSKLESAAAFQDWVFEEVLPSIRKTGSYNASQREPTRLEMLQMALEAEQEKERLKAEVIELKPAADALERLSAAEGSLCVTNAAKALNIKPKQLFSWLDRNRWIYRRPGSHWIAYSARIEQGVLEHKISTIITTDGEERITEQVRITPKGMAALSKQLNSTTH